MMPPIMGRARVGEAAWEAAPPALSVRAPVKVVCGGSKPHPQNLARERIRPWYEQGKQGMAKNRQPTLSRPALRDITPKGP